MGVAIRIRHDNEDDIICGGSVYSIGSVGLWHVNIELCVMVSYFLCV